MICHSYVDSTVNIFATGKIYAHIDEQIVYRSINLTRLMNTVLLWFLVSLTREEVEKRFHSTTKLSLRYFCQVKNN